VPLEDRDAAALQMSDALFIDIRADYIVPRFGETRTGDKSNVATTDY